MSVTTQKFSLYFKHATATINCPNPNPFQIPSNAPFSLILLWLPLPFRWGRGVVDGDDVAPVMSVLKMSKCGDCFVNKSCHLHHLLLQQGDGNPRTDSIREVRQCRMPRRSKMAWHFTPVWLTRQHENLWDLWGSSTWAFLVFPITFPHFLYCPSQLLVSKSSCYQFALRRFRSWLLKI